MDEDIFNDDLDIMDIIEFGFPRKVFLRTNPFEDLDELTFFKRFRLYKNTVLHLLTLIEEELEYSTNKNNSVSPINQLLCCLRFYASPCYLSNIADYMDMDISTVSRIIVRVTEAIARLFPRFVKMPKQNEFVREQNKFYEVARFPRVIGLVDGTHIRIQSPGGEDAEVYRNRKSYFSLNVQVVGSADLKFLNVARWPVSVHDATIFANSNLRAQFEGRYFPNCILLGDSGYPLKNYLLTPLGNPLTREQQLYNEAHIKTRNIIERIIGIWKRRFPVLAYGIRLNLETAKTLIIATAVLHNLARDMNEPEPPTPDDINAEELEYLIHTADIPQVLEENNFGVNYVQNEIITYFSTLYW